jgi:hypothetical protein
MSLAVVMVGVVMAAKVLCLLITVDPDTKTHRVRLVPTYSRSARNQMPKASDFCLNLIGFYGQYWGRSPFNEWSAALR